MNSHEEHLIVELASGSLPEEEARRAEASLSEEARRELAAHRLLLGAVTKTEQPVMTDIERGRLHRRVTEGISDITRELNATQITVPTGPTPKRVRTIRWMRFGSAATVAALFLGVVAVGTQLQGGSSDSSDTTTSLAAATADTSIAAGESSAADGLTEELFDALADDAPPPEQTTTLLGRAFSELAVPQAPWVNADTVESDLEDVARFVTESASVDLAAVEDLACFEVAALDALPGFLVKAFTLMYRGQDADGYTDAIGFQTDAVDDEAAIRIYNSQTCVELATTPR
ncbi:MAG: hypothetical protein V3W06_05970 [Acidimicrobiia bacterium]